MMADLSCFGFLKFFLMEPSYWSDLILFGSGFSDLILFGLSDLIWCCNNEWIM
jgi:hypothetical protein